MAEVYLGSEPFPNLSRKQVIAIETAVKVLPDQSWKEGFWRELYAELGDAPSYTHADVVAAIETCFANNGGIVSPNLPDDEE
jgi:hypothetical protein